MYDNFKLKKLFGLHGLKQKYLSVVRVNAIQNVILDFICGVYEADARNTNVR